MTLPTVKAKLLDGKRGLIVGIANDRSIAWGCARAFRAFGAELAITYLNDKAKPHVEPLAREVEAAIFMPMDVMVEGELEAVFDRIAQTWGKLDFLVHSIAFSTKEALGGRVTDVPRAGFQVTMDVSVLVVPAHGPPRRALDEGRWHALHHDLLRLREGGGELQHHGRRQGRARMRRALPRRRARPQGHPRPRHLPWPPRHPRRLRHP